MKLGSLVWLESKSEGVVRLTKEFNNETGIFQLDALKDWIWELQKEYEQRHELVFSQTKDKPQ